MQEHTTHPDAQWFPDAGLGLFLHWGISSVHGNTDISWGMMKNFPYSPEIITPEAYFDLAKRFDPDAYDPDKWLKAAAAAGFRYAVLTTRHHDSFALWPSRFGDFSTKNYMGGRDLLADYVEACRKNGLKVGFYYSPPDFRTAGDYMDYGGWRSGGNTGKPVPKEIGDYISAVIRGQITELLTRYGKIDLLWYDGGREDRLSREETYVYQPGIVIGRGEGTDFLSTECSIPDTDYYEKNLKEHWWECCHEWNNCWGYTKADETDYKTAGTVFGFYKAVRSMQGNLLINMGPNARGELPDIAYERMGEFGELLVKESAFK